MCVCAASASSFSPVTVLATNGSPVITISGLGLDVVSVRAVRFEPAATCTATTVNATSGTVSGGLLANVGGSNETLLSVTLNATIPAGSYSVCMDLIANAVGGAYAKVGSSQLLIGLCGCMCICVCVCVCL